MNGRLRLLERPTAELSSIRSDQTKDNVKIYIFFILFRLRLYLFSLEEKTVLLTPISFHAV